MIQVIVFKNGVVLVLKSKMAEIADEQAVKVLKKEALDYQVNE